MSINQIKQDLLDIYSHSNSRGLRQSTKWAAELLSSIKNQNEIKTKCFPRLDLNNTFEHPIVPKMMISDELNMDFEYLFAKSIFDLAIEKERLDRMIEPTSVVPNYLHQSFIGLKNNLEKEFKQNELAKNDGYLYYIYAIVLLKLGRNSDALEALNQSILINPLCWCSWHQLSQVIRDDSELQRFVSALPDIWIKSFFLASVYLEIQMNEEAICLYKDLLLTFEDNNHIKTQIAIVNYNLRYFEDSIKSFTDVQQSDPYKLDAMDIYSNLLYVKEMQTELSSLAHFCNRIDPFRVETCFCIANFYSLRGQHAKSVIYFSRALQLNPKYLSAWTLMGHEYIELKNTNAAIQAYRSAIKCNKRDYRAWYGLGQAYEILRMPAYSLYYYSKAHFLKPTDTRLILAIGQTYEKISRYEEAAACYSKAGFSSLIKLANLYERMNEEHKAAAIYSEFVNEFESKKSIYNLSVTDLSAAYKYLAFYFYKFKRFKESRDASQICMYFNEYREEIKDLLIKLEQENQSMNTTDNDSMIIE
ncbi:Cell division cycle protein 23 -like protein [Sarcoptes scabiei]|uniref:Cell division cycle protein 23 -like protein n=1 Tax=Sarcoptes scabiei TaxID=52283 RepID=A0A834RGM9_SARSC|nr:Cell division cycle protein 23 -like protein [Sarcoptes scabiei]